MRSAAPPLPGSLPGSVPRSFSAPRSLGIRIAAELISRDPALIARLAKAGCPTRAAMLANGAFGARRVAPSPGPNVGCEFSKPTVVETLGNELDAPRPDARATLTQRDR